MPAETKPRLHPGARDPISDRHRSWGQPCLSTDMDFVLLEFAPGARPVALVDYKLGLRRELSYGEKQSLLAIANLAGRAELPGYLVKYEPEPWRFAVWPMGPLSSGLYPHDRGETITELAFVTFLYALRGLDLPAGVANGLDDVL